MNQKKSKAPSANEAFRKWATVYKKATRLGDQLLWPSETLVRLFCGNYIPGLNKQYHGKSVIDVGLGNGNNLVFLASLGLQLYGTEVAQDICDMVSQKLKILGYASDLQQGTNRGLPFKNNQFDYLVSWNVLHYENNEADIRSAITEYARVLKPGGRFFLSTTGPEHKILKDGSTVGPHLYRIGRRDDFRKGQTFFYFDSSGYIQYYFQEKFADVMVGKTNDFLFTETLDWFVVTGLKK